MILQHLEDDPEPEAPGFSQVLPGPPKVPQVKIRQRLGYCQGMTLVAAVFAAHDDAEVEVQKDGRLGVGP